MKKIGRIVALLTALLMVVVLSACSCGNTDGSSSSSFSSSSTSSSSSSSSSTSSSTSSSSSSSQPSTSSSTTSSSDSSGTTSSSSGSGSESGSGSSDDSVGQVMQGDSQESLSSFLNAAEAQQVRPALAPNVGEISKLSGERVNWGPGVERDENGRILGAVRAQAQYGQYGGLFIGPNEKTLYLTFDEGYENGYTSVILDTLQAKRVPAVFFVTSDYVSRESELIERILAEGHIVGNHSVHHKSMPSLSLEDAAAEITGLHNTMADTYDTVCTLFRPPEGSFSEQTLALAKDLGYTSVFWSFGYVDWDVNKQPDPANALKKLTDALHPGAIYLLHAVSSTNSAILGDFIDQARAAGYTFALIPA